MFTTLAQATVELPFDPVAIIQEGRFRGWIFAAQIVSQIPFWAWALVILAVILN